VSSGWFVGRFAPNSATLAASTAYDPLGNQTASSGTKSTLGFQGGYTDPTTANVDMAAPLVLAV
jgi:hypothetical protein